MTNMTLTHEDFLDRFNRIVADYDAQVSQIITGFQPEFDAHAAESNDLAAKRGEFERDRSRAQEGFDMLRLHQLRGEFAKLDIAEAHLQIKQTDLAARVQNSLSSIGPNQDILVFWEDYKWFNLEQEAAKDLANSKIFQAQQGLQAKTFGLTIQAKAAQENMQAARQALVQAEQRLQALLAMK